MARKVSQHVAEATLRPAEPAAHWKKLKQGDRVSVRLTPAFVTLGQVDAITWDHTALWVELDGGGGRVLVHCSDGVEVALQEE
ncbi:hypothetical protein M1E17_01050 [Arthrobacter sp. D1-29]